MQTVAYAFEPEDFEKLQIINEKLYDESKPFSSDDKRDLANYMMVVLDKVYRLTEDDLSTDE